MKVKTSDILTQKELESGIWQFLIDHSVPYEKDLWLVKFLQISTKEDLMRRIYARASGLYKIKNEQEIKRQLQNRIEFLHGLEIQYKKSNKREIKINRLKKDCLWKYKIIVFLRKITKKLIKEWVYEV